MDRRQIKKDSYCDFLSGYITLSQQLLETCEQMIQVGIENADKESYRKFIDAMYDVELALCSLCLLLRKMDENSFITLDQQIRYDVNSLIHSHRFRFLSKKTLEVTSKRGKEFVDLEVLLNYAKSCLH